MLIATESSPTTLGFNPIPLIIVAGNIIAAVQSRRAATEAKRAASAQLTATEIAAINAERERTAEQQQTMMIVGGALIAVALLRRRQ